MLDFINTLLLTLSPSRDSDRADSLRPKELRFYRTTHLGFMAIAHQLGLFLPWLRSFCGKSRNSTETYLFERPSGLTTICTISGWLRCSQIGCFLHIPSLLARQCVQGVSSTALLSSHANRSGIAWGFPRVS
jgi:hypothetical protein